MNEENILLLSHLLELLFLLSIVFAILAVWMNWRAKRVQRLKGGPAPQPQTTRRTMNDRSPD